MIETLLIANRGEIACRIIRTCRSLGIRSVAVFSDADAQAQHVAQADLAVRLGGKTPTDSYLHQDALLAAAAHTGAQAIHPGYGFLAENADFAERCAAAGLLFVGPTPASMRLLGNKRAAKQTVAQAGVPVIPGSAVTAAQAPEALAAAAASVGFPLMVKAAAGGGGVGMRLVRSAAELPAALASARRDALAAFGSDELLLERAIEHPRHIEVQIFGDQHGNLVHLGERDCSIQRRHQKILEEAPASNLDPATRAALHTAALAAGRAAQYTSAGTVEFLLAPDNAFYFLEMNTRLQVEHPVTEAITGLDLVAWQILVAEGGPLPLAQAEIVFSGHAIEARIYAEDADADFRPASGPIALWAPPAEARVDAGIASGDTVSVFYDPMLAKVIVHAAERPAALRRLGFALEHTVLLGCVTNLDFLRRLVGMDALRTGPPSTSFLQDHPVPAADDLPLALIGATLIKWAEQAAGHWRNNPNSAPTYRYTYRASTWEVRVHPHMTGPGVELELRLSNGEIHSLWQIGPYQHGPDWLTLELAGVRRTWRWVRHGADLWVGAQGRSDMCQPLERLPVPQPRASAASMRAPLPGVVLEVLVDVGETVEVNQPLLRLEAMKMEHTIRATAPGVVHAIFCRVGDTLAADAVLVALEAAEELLNG